MYENYSVLFVDDDVSILNSLRRGLVDETYKCFFATDGRKALSIMEKDRIHVLVTDMRMPEMDGLTLLKAAKVKNPGMVCIILSGYTQLQQILTTINQVDIFKFLTKPWKLEGEFRSIIRQAVEYYMVFEQRDELEKALQQRNVAYQKMLRNIDEMMQNIKTNADAAKHLGDSSFEYIIKTIETERDTAVIKKQAERVRQFMKDFGLLFPYEPQETNIKTFLRDVDSFISDINNVKSYKSNVTGIKETKLMMRSELIEKIFKDTIKEIACYGRSYMSIMKYGESTRNDNEYILESTLLLKDDSETGLGRETIADMDRSLDLMNNMYNTVAGFWNGSFKCIRSGMDYAIKIILRFK